VIRIDVLTIFTRLFEAFAEESMIGIAVRGGQLDLRIRDLRDFAGGPHKSVDDAPYGGGPGMVMRPEPLVAGIEALAGAKGPSRQAHVALMTPQGVPLDQARLRALSSRPHLVLVCGRYEGVDQRAIDLAVDEEISLGDYVLSGGEVAALALLDACVRLIPGVIGAEASVAEESFSGGLLEFPQFTRPQVFEGRPIPDVLLSGDHAKVAAWRRAEAERITRERRPDLWQAYAARRPKSP
jgi:tRNA (guanine37-N1)-methyltransferase